MSIIPWRGRPDHRPPPLKSNPGFTPQDQDGLPATPANQESLLKLSYTDRAGQLQYAVIRLTAPITQVARQRRLRAAFKLFLYILGARLITMEIGTERTITVAGLRIQPRLHVIARRGERR